MLIEKLLAEKAIEGVIFDMDGLLVNSEPFWQQAEMAVFRTVGLELTIANCLETTGLPTDVVVNYWYEKQPWVGKSPQQINDEIIETTAGMLAENAEAMPGADALISFLRKKSVPLGLASASPIPIIEIVLQKLGLSDAFTTYHSATLEKNNKPHPDVYLTVAKRLNVPIERCLILEDSVNGVKGGLAAGGVVVAVPEPHHANEPFFANAYATIGSLTDLIN